MPIFAHGGDSLLILILFWSMFLPIGEVLSIDSKIRKKSIPLGKNYFSIATVGLISQMFLLYWSAGFMKWNTYWIGEGTAILKALSAEHMTKSLGLHLIHFKGMLKCLSFGTVMFEIFGPLLCFSPFKTQWFRGSVACTFILFHFLIGSILEVGLFTLVTPALWIVFLPSGFWDKWTVVNFQKQWSSFRTDTYFIKHWFVQISLMLVIVVTVIDFTAYLYPKFPQVKYKPVKEFMRQANLWQKWPMFSPVPFDETLWFVIRGKLSDGQEVNMQNWDLPISFEKPKNVLGTYKSYRWRDAQRKFVYDALFQSVLPNYSRFITRQWNKAHSVEQQISFIEIFVVFDGSLQIGKSEAYTRLLWSEDF